MRGHKALSGILLRALQGSRESYVYPRRWMEAAGAVQERRPAVTHACRRLRTSPKVIARARSENFFGWNATQKNITSIALRYIVNAVPSGED